MNALPLPLGGTLPEMWRAINIRSRVFADLRRRIDNERCEKIGDPLALDRLLSIAAKLQQKHATQWWIDNQKDLCALDSIERALGKCEVRV